MTETAGTVEPGETGTPMLFGRFRTWLVMVAFVIILAGVLFGYDQGVIAGALGGMTASFDLSTMMQEVVTSLVTLGALVGALLGGGLADRLDGREHWSSLVCFSRSERSASPSPRARES